MITIVIVVAILILGIASSFIYKRPRSLKPSAQYHFTRKEFLMTKAENDFFDVIVQAVGDSYYVLPQVHLSEFLDHKVKGQNWKHALHYINQKSVDYLVCDKQYRRPLLAIELDDWSHDSQIRKERDANVERILQEAGVPLLRFRDVQNAPSSEIAVRIQERLTPQAQRESRR